MVLHACCLTTIRIDGTYIVLFFTLDNEIPNSNNNKPLYRQGMDVMEIDGSKELPKIANGTMLTYIDHCILYVSVGDDTALASGITLPNDRTGYHCKIIKVHLHCMQCR